MTDKTPLRIADNTGRLSVLLSGVNEALRAVEKHRKDFEDGRAKGREIIAAQLGDSVAGKSTLAAFDAETKALRKKHFDGYLANTLKAQRAKLTADYREIVATAEQYGDPRGWIASATLGHTESQAYQLQLQNSPPVALRRAMQMAIGSGDIPLAGACLRILESWSNQDKDRFVKAHSLTNPLTHERMEATDKAMCEFLCADKVALINLNAEKAKAGLERLESAVHEVAHIASFGEPRQLGTQGLDKIGQGVMDRAAESDAFQFDRMKIVGDERDARIVENEKEIKPPTETPTVPAPADLRTPTQIRQQIADDKIAQGLKARGVA